MQPTVSVLIPVRNAESTVESAVRSMLRQTLTDFEIVVVNDGSTDSTPSILDRLANEDDRIRVIHAPARGIIHALNAGISICSGEFIARMDADDICHPSRLEAQVEMMEREADLGVCSCLIRMFPRNGLPGGMARYEQWLNSLTSAEQISRDIFVESPVAHPSVMLRRSELIEIGGYQERGWAEDYDLWLRYHAAGKKFAKVRETLFCWRHSPGRLTFTDSRYSIENFLRAKAHYIARMLAGSARPVVLWGAGMTGRRIGKHLMREGVRIEAVVDIDPKKIGRTMRALAIVPTDYLRCRNDAFVIAAVSSHGARDLIRKPLRHLGFVETVDFICAA
ncbi:MAG: hypothetical protein A2Z18_10005 [Armatimonadetes bacterium RBG_16_58_9]|nr:MAG: hypothetical protein A2Z18_10005 [Armatimonadetes bacterium RBG_16_58_9]